MILTLNDKREISQIIASFTDEDYERINSEVDRLCKRCDPISEMLRSYKPDEHTKDAIDWLEDDDCNYQEKGLKKQLWRKQQGLALTLLADFVEDAGQEPKYHFSVSSPQKK